MARQRGRPREVPEGLVTLRLAVTPEERRQIQVAAGLAGLSMAQFARKAVVDAARAKIVAGGMDPDRLPDVDAPAGGEAVGGEAGGGAGKGRRGGKKA
jgi:uncharacterized membrane protein